MEQFFQMSNSFDNEASEIWKLSWQQVEIDREFWQKLSHHLMFEFVFLLDEVIELSAADKITILSIWTRAVGWYTSTTQ